MNSFVDFERLVHFKIPCLEKSCNSSSVNDLQAFQANQINMMFILWNKKYKSFSLDVIHFVLLILIP